MMKWIWIILAVLYILSPYDLLPDFIPIRGWIDDAIVLALLYRQIRAMIRTRTDRDGAGNGRTPFGGTNDSHTTHGQTPYEVLGVAPTATAQEIKEAYRKLANQYHPDKVAHLGKEFQDLAENRFKQIQQAYQSLTQSKA